MPGKREPEWLRQLRAVDKAAQLVLGKNETARAKEVLAEKMTLYAPRWLRMLLGAEPPKPPDIVDPNDPYNILDIPPDSPDWLVDLAYKHRARKVHPDMGGSDEEMKRVNNAYGKIKKRRKSRRKASPQS